MNSDLRGPARRTRPTGRDGSGADTTTERTSMTAAVQLPVTGTYRLDPGASTIGFATRHLFGLGAVRGTFAVADGRIEVTDPVTASAVTARVAAGSVDTGLAARDGVVRSATYLDAEHHPYFEYASTGLERRDGQWVLCGRLTVRGVTRPVDVLITELRVEGTGLRVVATAAIDRYEFGITAMRGMTGRRLALRLELTAAK